MDPDPDTLKILTSFWFGILFEPRTDILNESAS